MEMQTKLDLNQEEIKANKEEIIADMKVWHEEMKACQDPREAKVMIVLEEVKAVWREIQEKYRLWRSTRKSQTKKPQSKLSDHWRTDIGTGLWL
jgi:hypothetical protein